MGVEALGLGVDDELGEFQAAALDGGDVIGPQTVLDDDGFERREALELFDPDPEGLLVDLQEPADRRVGTLDVDDILPDVGNLESGPIVGQDDAIPVADESPGGRQGPHAGPVRFGQVPIFLVLEDLDVPVVGKRENDQDGDDPEDRVGPADHRRQVFVDLPFRHGRPQVSRRRARMRRSAAMSATPSSAVTGGCRRMRPPWRLTGS